MRMPTVIDQTAARQSELAEARRSWLLLPTFVFLAECAQWAALACEEDWTLKSFAVHPFDGRPALSWPILISVATFLYAVPGLLRVNRIEQPGLLRFFNIIWSIFEGLLFVPVASHLLWLQLAKGDFWAQTVCGLGLILGFGLFLALLGLQVTSCDIYPRRDNPLFRASRRPDCLFIVLKACMTLLSSADSQTNWKWWGVIFSNFGMLVATVSHLPFYNMWINSSRCALFSAIMVEKIGTAWTNMAPNHLCLAGAALGFLLPRLRLAFLTPTTSPGASAPQINFGSLWITSADDVSLSARFVYDVPTPENVETADHLFGHGLQKYPRHAGLRLAYSVFLLEFKSGQGVSKQLAEAAQWHPAWDEQVTIAALRWKCGQLEGGDSVEDTSQRRLLKAAEQGRREALHRVTVFWRHVVRRHDIRALDAASRHLERAVRSTDSLFRSLYSRFPASSTISNAYRRFLRMMRHDPSHPLLSQSSSSSGPASALDNSSSSDAVEAQKVHERVSRENIVRAIRRGALSRYATRIRLAVMLAIVVLLLVGGVARSLTFSSAAVLRRMHSAGAAAGLSQTVLVMAHQLHSGMRVDDPTALTEMRAQLQATLGELYDHHQLLLATPLGSVPEKLDAGTDFVRRGVHYVSSTGPPSSADVSAISAGALGDAWSGWVAALNSHLAVATERLHTFHQAAAALAALIIISAFFLTTIFVRPAVKRVQEEYANILRLFLVIPNDVVAHVLGGVDEAYRSSSAEAQSSIVALGTTGSIPPEVTSPGRSTPESTPEPSTKSEPEEWEVDAASQVGGRTYLLVATLIVVLLAFTAASVVLMVSDASIHRQVHLASQRAAETKRLLSLSWEIAMSTSAEMRLELARQLDVAVAELQRAHRSLRYGDDSPASGPLDRLLDFGCQTRGEGITYLPDNSYGYVHPYANVDFALKNLVDGCQLLAATAIASPCVAPSVRGPHDQLRDAVMMDGVVGAGDDLDEVMADADGDADAEDGVDGDEVCVGTVRRAELDAVTALVQGLLGHELDRLRTEYNDAAAAHMAWRASVESGMLLVCFLIIIVVFFAGLRPLGTRLEEEELFNASLLLYLPAEFVSRIDELREFTEGRLPGHAVIQRGGSPSAGTRSSASISSGATNTGDEGGVDSSSVLNAMCDPVIIVDPAGVIVSCNPSAEALFQYTGAALIGKDVATLLPTYITETFMRAYYIHGEGTNKAVVGRTSAGRELSLLLSMSPYSHENVVQYICCFKVVELEYFSSYVDMYLVRQVEHPLLEAAMAAKDGLWYWDMDTGTLVTSARFRALLGFSDRAEELGTTMDAWRSRVHPEDQMRFETDMLRVMEGPDDDEARLAIMDGLDPDIAVQERALEAPLIEGEFRIRHRTGAYLWFLIRGDSAAPPLGSSTRDGSESGRRMLESGRFVRARPLPVSAPRAWGGTLSDITARRSARNSLARKKEMDLLSEMKRQFLANMSHELKTPLQGIIGLSTNMTKRADIPPLPLNQVKQIKNQALTLFRVVQDILDFTSVGSSQSPLVELEFDVHRTAEVAVSNILLDSYEKGLDVIVVVSPACPRALFGDEPKLTKVLLNLLANAVKFTQNGHVMLVIDCEEGNKGDTTQLLFKIVDSGIGIKPRDLKSLFKEFSQVDSSHTRQHGGTGLGLVMCKHLVEQMSGVITVESDLGQGSTFWFKLPFKNVPGSTNYLRVDIQGPALVLYENEMVARVLERMLGHHFDIVVVTSRTDAISRLTSGKEQSRPFRWIVVDEGKNAKNIMWATSELQPMFPEVYLAVIAAAQSHPYCREIPPRNIIIKPFTVPAMLAVVEKLPMGSSTASSYSSMPNLVNPQSTINTDSMDSALLHGALRTQPSPRSARSARVPSPIQLEGISTPARVRGLGAQAPSDHADGRVRTSPEATRPRLGPEEEALLAASNPSPRVSSPGGPLQKRAGSTPVLPSAQRSFESVVSSPDSPPRGSVSPTPPPRALLARPESLSVSPSVPQRSPPAQAKRETTRPPPSPPRSMLRRGPLSEDSVAYLDQSDRTASSAYGPSEDSYRGSDTHGSALNPTRRLFPSNATGTTTASADSPSGRTGRVVSEGSLASGERSERLMGGHSGRIPPNVPLASARLRQPRPAPQGPSPRGPSPRQPSQRQAAHGAEIEAVAKRVKDAALRLPHHYSSPDLDHEPLGGSPSAAAQTSASPVHHEGYEADDSASARSVQSAGKAMPANVGSPVNADDPDAGPMSRSMSAFHRSMDDASEGEDSEGEVYGVTLNPALLNNGESGRDLHPLSGSRRGAGRSRGYGRRVPASPPAAAPPQGGPREPSSGRRSDSSHFSSDSSCSTVGRSTLVGSDVPAPSRKRVLLVEDTEVNAMMAEAMCVDLGYDVDRVENGLRCVDKFNESRNAYHIILMDIQMPLMDGYMATHKIRDLERGTSNHIPIIAFTCHDTEGDRAKATEAGMDDFLAKPVDPSTLRKVLAKWADSSHRPPPVTVIPGADASRKLPRGRSGDVAAAVGSGAATSETRPYLPEPQEPEIPDRLPFVLLVEDNLVNQFMAQQMLQDVGCDVDVASDGLQCIERVRQRDYDMILMDLLMPKCDGYEATKRIREMGIGTKVVAFTCLHSSEEERGKCFASGMDDFLQKPIEKADLKRVLAGIKDRK